MLNNTIKILQKRIKTLQQKNNDWQERYHVLDAGHNRLFKNFCKLQQENEQLRARVERMRELLAKAYDEIETYKCLWKSSKPSGCDCPKPTALQDEIEQALAEIDKAIGGKEDVTSMGD